MSPRALTTRSNIEEFAVTFTDTPVSLASAIRRTILADVPTIAIEKVSVIDNNVSNGVVTRHEPN